MTESFRLFMRVYDPCFSLKIDDLVGQRKKNWMREIKNEFERVMRERERVMRERERERAQIEMASKRVINRRARENRRFLFCSLSNRKPPAFGRISSHFFFLIK